jgi:hypothetical protein
MMPPVYELLRDSAAVVTIVGDRIGAHGDIQQPATRPYITWQVVSGAAESGIDDLPDIDFVQVQVNCWHQTDAGVRALVQAVREALEPYARVASYPVDQREVETRLYWIAIQFDWWLHR